MGQENFEIYDLIKKLFTIIKNKNWKIEYVFWELNLLKYIGYDLNISDFCKYDLNSNNEKKYFIENKSKKLIVPSFLIEKNENNISDRDIFDALILITEYMKKNIFIPNNINLPLSRQNFINYFK
jgi:Recombination protein O C terminal.